MTTSPYTIEYPEEYVGNVTITVDRKPEGCWLICLTTDRVPSDVAKEVEKLLQRFECRTWLMEVDNTEPYQMHVWFIVKTWNDVKEVSHVMSKSQTWKLSKVVYKNLTPSTEGKEVVI